MEYRKETRHPLDRADEAFLRMMLEENAAEEQYGEILSHRKPRQNNPARSGCGCVRQADEHNGGNRSGCGCGRQAEEQDSGCRSGCFSRRMSRQAENADAVSGCGCRRGGGHTENAAAGCGCSGRRPAEQADNVRPGCGCAGGLSGRRAEAEESYDMTGCGCGNGRVNAVRDGYPLAMVYSPVQEWREILEPEEAMENGTLFRELVFPWYPAACRKDNNCGCQGGQR